VLPTKNKFVIVIFIIPILFGLWYWQSNRKAPASTSPDLEELQALPYVQWVKAKDTAHKQGVTRFEPKRVWHGYNLYTNDENTAYLMDMGGKILHSWNFGKKLNKCEYAIMLPGGEALGVCMGQGLYKVDWDSKLLWRNRMFIHHDVEPLPDGSFWVTRRERHREYKSRKVVFDSLQRISADGKQVEKWYTFDYLDEIQRWHKPSPLDTPATENEPRVMDYYHMNTVKLLPENPHEKTDKRFQKGNLLICLRNVNLIAILDQDTMKIVWGYGVEELEWPHMPVMLPNGNILIFDNGVRRRYSRVVEIDPISKKTVWSYEKKGFFSDLQGSAQRLPNGNTLICESTRGHVFEVDREGNIVWEFWNPDMKKESRKAIYRFLRLPFEAVPHEKLTRK
jgi:hypothetical protein